MKIQVVIDFSGLFCGRREGLRALKAKELHRFFIAYKNDRKKGC
jgi:hypothetical protein